MARAVPPALTLTTGQRINWLMGVTGAKPGDLAARVDVDDATLWRYRQDRRPIPSDVLTRLADELGTSADFLLCRTDDPRPFDVALRDRFRRMESPPRDVKEMGWPRKAAA